MSVLVASCYAAARRSLERARVAQQNALIFAVDVYRGGALGRRGRRLQKEWHQRRAVHLAEVLRIRRQIRELRAELRRLELDDTLPPRSAA